jgi:hypothetical protein
MSTSQKYTLHVRQKNDTWTAEIHRRVSKIKSTISKRKAHFPTQEAAQEWGEVELKGFQSHQTELNLQRSVKRGEKRRQQEKQAEEYRNRLQE